LIEVLPDDSNIYIARGDSYLMSGAADKAITDLTKTISLNPGREELLQACIDRSSAYGDKKMWNEEIADCQAALAIDSDSEAAYSNLSSAYLHLEQIDDGLDAAKMAIALNPNDPFTLMIQFNLLLKKKDFNGAHKALSQLTGQSSVGLNNAAWILATCPDASFRDGKRAVELATQACEDTHWKQFFVLDTLAAAYAEAGDFPNAIKYENQVLANPLGDEEKQEAQKRLALFEAKQAYRDES
jgi:tetratricopeptide (TPR) repeat protein